MPVETEEDKTKRGQRNSPRTPAKEQLPEIPITARISNPLRDMKSEPNGTQVTKRTSCSTITDGWVSEANATDDERKVG